MATNLLNRGNTSSSGQSPGVLGISPVPTTPASPGLQNDAPPVDAAQGGAIVGGRAAAAAAQPAAAPPARARHAAPGRDGAGRGATAAPTV